MHDDIRRIKKKLDAASDALDQIISEEWNNQWSEKTLRKIDEWYMARDGKNSLDWEKN